MREHPRRFVTTLLVGALCIAAVVVAGLWFLNRTPVENVMAAYNAGTMQERQEIAARFLEHHPVSVLLAQLEETHVDTVCHTEAHPIGRALYQRTPNFTDAIRQCGSACSYGCFHGVLMEMFKTDSDTLGGVIEDESPEDYLAHVRAVAGELCTSPQVEGVVRHHYCYHGLGHVFNFLSGDDLDSAIESCGIFKNGYINDACVSGAFMEHFFSATSTPTAEAQSRKPCDAYPKYLSSCFVYKAYIWIKGWGGVRQALDACESFGAEKNRCIKSVAQAAASPELVATEAGIESICGQYTGETHNRCVVGMLTKVLETNNGDTTDRACDGIAQSYRAQCLDILHSYPYFSF